jgi:hypothetical protein
MSTQTGPEADRDAEGRGGSETAGGGEEGARTDLAAEVAVLEAENERLRREYARSRRVEYRRTALGLAVVGALAAAAAVLFPSVRGVLFALAATGGFAAVLTYYLTPERVLPASVAERSHAAWADAVEALIADLGLGPARVYVPRPETHDVRLFLPQARAYAVPDAEELDSALVVTGSERERGLALRPAGDALLRELARTLSGELASDPATAAEQLADGLTEQFEIVDSAAVERTPGRVTVGVSGSAYGDVTRFDHPASSLLGAGLARALGEPVSVAVEETPDGRAEYAVTCTWNAPDGAE